MEIIVSDRILIPRRDLSKDLLDELKDLCRHTDPRYWKSKALGYRPKGSSKIITFRLNRSHLSLPRGIAFKVLPLLREKGVDYTIRDERFSGAVKTPFEFISPPGFDLIPYQERGPKVCYRKSQGYIEGVCGAGKTVILFRLIAQAQTPALFIVHTTALMEQTVEEAQRFLLPSLSDIGTLGGSAKSKIIKQTARGKLKPLTVITNQTALKRIDDICMDRFGIVILNEAHHAPADSFFLVLDRFNAKWRIGDTATPNRKDGLGFLLYELFGDRIFQVTDEESQAAGRTMPVEVSLIPTKFWFDYFRDNLIEKILQEKEEELDEDEFEDLEEELSTLADRHKYLKRIKVSRGGFDELVKAMDGNRSRNKLILRNVLSELQDGRRVLLLAYRRVTVRKWVKWLQRAGYETIALIGGDDCVEETARGKKALKSGQVRAGVSTIQLYREAMDVPSLETGFLLNPIAPDNRVLLPQIVGRFARTAEGKDLARFIIFWDRMITRLETFKSRIPKKYGATVLEEGLDGP